MRIYFNGVLQPEPRTPRRRFGEVRSGGILSGGIDLRQQLRETLGLAGFADPKPAAGLAGRLDDDPVPRAYMGGFWR